MSDLLIRLGMAVLLPRDELLRLIRSAPHRYKVFQIAKRTQGQFRTIAQPARGEGSSVLGDEERAQSVRCAPSGHSVP